MIASYLGYFAGLSASAVWSITSIFFTFAGRMVGSAVVNRTRLLMALCFVTLTHLLTRGALFPFSAEPFRWHWLALSGLIGFVIGDGFLFQAFVMIGPRLSMLLMALAPVLSTVLAWVFLGETLEVVELTGIALAVGGIALVVSDRRGNRNGNTPEEARSTERDLRRYGLGLLCGLGGGLGQALGLMASKMGLVNYFSASPEHLAFCPSYPLCPANLGEFPALSGNLIRLVSATAAIWAWTLVRGQARHNMRVLRSNPRAVMTITGGAVAGPFLGVWFSLLAVQHAPLGIASTLMSLAPIILLPVARVIFNERITLRSVGGTILAVAGVAFLFLLSGPQRALPLSLSF